MRDERTPDFAGIYPFADDDGELLFPSPRQAYAMWAAALYIRDAYFEEEPLESIILEGLPRSIATTATPEWIARFGLANLRAEQWFLPFRDGE